MKTYKLSRPLIFFIYGLLGLVSLAGVMAIFLGLKGGEGRVPAQPWLLVWLGVLAWVWQVYARIPLAITWREEGVLEFKSLVGTTQVPVHEIMAIKATPLNWGFIKLTYQGGSLRLLTQMTGLYELLGAIKAGNPGVEITGC